MSFRVSPPRLVASVVAAVLTICVTSCTEDDGPGGNATETLAPDTGPLTGFAASEDTLMVVQSDIGGDRPIVGLMDLTSRQWTQPAEPPFTAALHAPHVLWDGSDFVVLGSPCEREGPDTGDAYVDCEPGGTEIAKFNPTSATWSSHVRRELDSPGGTGLIGLHSGRAVIREGTASGSDTLVMVDLDTGEAMGLPAPPIPGASFCVVGDELVAATRYNVPPDAGGDLNHFDPIAASTLSLASHAAWTAPTASGVTYTARQVFNLICVPDGVLAVLPDTALEEAPTQSYLFRPPMDAWLPSPAPPMPFSLATTSVRVDSTTTMWTDEMVATRRPDGGWSVARHDHGVEGLPIRAAPINGSQAVVNRPNGRTADGHVRYTIQIETIPAAD